MEDSKIETVNVNGVVLCFQRVNGNLVKRQYIGYSTRDARKLFKSYLKTIN
jgi:hypothetical protein